MKSRIAKAEEKQNLQATTFAVSFHLTRAEKNLSEIPTIVKLASQASKDKLFIPVASPSWIYIAQKNLKPSQKKTENEYKDP